MLMINPGEAAPGYLETIREQSQLPCFPEFLVSEMVFSDSFLARARFCSHTVRRFTMPYITRTRQWAVATSEIFFRCG